MDQMNRTGPGYDREDNSFSAISETVQAVPGADINGYPERSGRSGGPDPFAVPDEGAVWQGSPSGGKNTPARKKSISRVVTALVVAAALLTAAVFAALYFSGKNNGGAAGETDASQSDTDAAAADASAEETPAADTTVSSAPDVLAEGACGENTTWQLNSEGVLSLSGAGETSSVAIGAASPWHAYAEQIKTIVVNEGITILNARIFNECVSAESVSLPQSLQKVKALVFQHCRNLRAIEIPAGVTQVIGTAFDDCGALESITVEEGNRSYAVFNGALCTANGKKLVRVPPVGASGFVFPDTVEIIGTDAFCGAIGIESIELPAGVTAVSAYAFDECWSLREITVDAKNPAFTAEGGVLYTKDMSALVVAPPILAGESFTVPDSVVTVENAAFSCTGLAEIVFPASLKTIEGNLLSLARQDVTLVFLGDAPEMENLPSIEAYSVTIRYDDSTAGWDALRAKDTENSIQWRAMDD